MARILATITLAVTTEVRSRHVAIDIPETNRRDDLSRMRVSCERQIVKRDADQNVVGVGDKYTLAFGAELLNTTERRKIAADFSRMLDEIDTEIGAEKSAAAESGAEVDAG